MIDVSNAESIGSQNGDLKKRRYGSKRRQYFLTNETPPNLKIVSVHEKTTRKNRRESVARRYVRVVFPKERAGSCEGGFKTL